MAITVQGLPGTGMPVMKSHIDATQAELIRRYVASRNRDAGR